MQAGSHQDAPCCRRSALNAKWLPQVSSGPSPRARSAAACGWFHRGWGRWREGCSPAHLQLATRPRRTLRSQKGQGVFLWMPPARLPSARMGPMLLWSQALRPELLPVWVHSSARAGMAKAHGLSGSNSGNVCSVIWRLQAQEGGASRAGSSEASPLGL